MSPKDNEPQRWWTQKAVSLNKENPKTVNPKDNMPKRPWTQKVVSSKNSKTVSLKDGEPKTQQTLNMGNSKENQKAANPKDEEPPKKTWTQKKTCQLSKNRTQKIHKPPKKENPPKLWTTKNLEPLKQHEHKRAVSPAQELDLLAIWLALPAQWVLTKNEMFYPVFICLEEMMCPNGAGLDNPSFDKPHSLAGSTKQRREKPMEGEKVDESWTMHTALEMMEVEAKDRSSLAPGSAQGMHTQPQDLALAELLNPEKKWLLSPGFNPRRVLAAGTPSLSWGNPIPLCWRQGSNCFYARAGCQFCH